MRNFFWRLIALVLSLSAGAVFLSTTATAQGRTITCESKYQRYEYCRVNTNDRVRLVRKLSSNPCTEGRSWGFDRRGVWVDDGCRAVFEVAYRGNSGGGWHGDDDYRPNRPGSIPSWAIGQFEGYNRRFNTDVSLRIHDSGMVIAMIGRRRITGHYDSRSREIVIGRERFIVKPERRGISTTEVGNSRNVIYYTRVR
jgi:hypothetical protein